MIEVDMLTKCYQSVRVVDRVSFSVGRGEILGFLGPNGAGKTTTMRMLTTWLPPTWGRAKLAGHDIRDEPLEVRRKVGYLPEMVPLYPDMRVADYLTYRAKLRDLPRLQRALAVDRVVEWCRLEDKRKSVIGTLSRGYRQRVGLAEVLLHEPEILILDEPTAGLDPIQTRDVRALIQTLGQRHTIILSTHILSEVEAICGRALVIVGGRLVLDQSMDAMRSERSLVVEVRGPMPQMANAIRMWDGVQSVEVWKTPDDHVTETTLLITPREGADPRIDLARRIVQEGWGLLKLDRVRSTLEERFVDAVKTGHAVIRDAPDGIVSKSARESA